jgi:lysophospholipase L1-like esterase
MMSCTKSATGVDGVANSASLCTASGANATVTQTLSLAAASRNSSLYIKRASGTGAVFVTRDGATWTDIASELSSAFYKRVVSVEAVGCAYGGCIVVPEMASTIANPTVGIKIASSGDSVAVDLVQDEVGSFPTSPITTSAAMASRSADSAYATVSPFAPLVLRYSLLATGYNAGYMTGAGGRNDASHFYTAYVNSYSDSLGGYINCYAYSGSGAVGQTTVFVPPLGPSPFRCVLSPGASITASMLGVVYTTATSATAQTFTSIHLGSQPGLNAAGGVVSGVCLDPSPSACPSLRTHSTAIAWVGDSITFGSAADPSRPPAALRALLKHRTVYNLGINGAPVSTCATLADGAISSGAGTLVLLCGVNSLGSGNGNAVLADLVSILNKAKSAGMKVIPVLLTPWASASTWTAAKQASQDVVNAGLLSWCSANGATCVDTSSLGSGLPASLLPAYDSGDGLHLNPAGGAALASLVAAANP